MNVALISCDDLPGWEKDDKPLIEALEQRGVTVHRPSWTEDTDWNQFAISVIRTTWDYHSQKEAFVRWCKTVPRLFNNAEIIQWNIHKSYLRELEQCGTAIAPTIWIDAHETVDVQKELHNFGSSKGFIKPQVGACASDTLRFKSDEVAEAENFLRNNAHQDMMFQPYLQSVETEGELTAVFIDGTFTHGVQKIPVNGDYRVQDDFGAVDMPYEFTKDELQTMQETLLTVPQCEELLYARFDYLRSDSGTLLLNELELIEPSLFFRHSEKSAVCLADAILKRV
jgi:hypothetical protein